MSDKYIKITGQPDDKVKYFCPMKCEGTKVYDKPGICPVCNMKLVSDNQNTSPEGQHHHHHS